MTTEERRTLVAEEVMGWELGDVWDCEPIWSDGHAGFPCEDWDPLESWADTGRVIDRMQELGWDIDMVCLGANGAFPNYDVRFTRCDAGGFQEPTVGSANDPNPKTAISLAALRALGVEVE